MVEATIAAVKSRGIIFSAPMVRAILEGRKTQTRRICKPQPQPYADFGGMLAFTGKQVICGVTALGEERFADSASYLQSPYGRPGDQLWVRETWQDVYQTYDGQCTTRKPNTACKHWIEFAATVEDGKSPPRWRSPIHLRRDDSRLALEITGIKVERLEDISEEDAKAEGVTLEKCTHPDCQSGNTRCAADSYRGAFAVLWNKINAKGGFVFGERPFVWAISFKVVKPETHE